MPALLYYYTFLMSVAAAVDCGICPAGNESGAAGDFPAARLLVTTQPTGNDPPTATAFTIQGVTEHDDFREYLVSLGLTSTRGNNSRPTPFHDKVQSVPQTFLHQAVPRRGGSATSCPLSGGAAVQHWLTCKAESRRRTRPCELLPVQLNPAAGHALRGDSWEPGHGRHLGDESARHDDAFLGRIQCAGAPDRARSSVQCAARWH